MRDCVRKSASSQVPCHICLSLVQAERIKHGLCTVHSKPDLKRHRTVPRNTRAVTKQTLLRSPASPPFSPTSPIHAPFYTSPAEPRCALRFPGSATGVGSSISQTIEFEFPSSLFRRIRYPWSSHNFGTTNSNQGPQSGSGPSGTLQPSERFSALDLPFQSFSPLAADVVEMHKCNLKPAWNQAF